MLLGAFAVACTDEVPTIPSSELYTREFVKRFGVVDKQHTWNIAERGNINVTVDRPSRILVSGIIGGKRYLLGDYAGVEGSRALNFDMPVGCTDLRVTDGRQEIYTKVGSRISFANKGRVIYEYPEHDVVKVTRTDYRVLSDEAIRSFGRYLPEGVVNVGKVTQNFTFVANGPFTIYPVFWQTNAYNTLGIYYESDELDENGNPKLIHVPFFTNKVLREGDTDSNLQYRVNTEMAGLEAAWVEPSSSQTVWPYLLMKPVDDNDAVDQRGYGFTISEGGLTEEQLTAFKQMYVERYKSYDIYGVDKGVDWQTPAEIREKRLLDDIEFSVNDDNSISVTRFHYTEVPGSTIEGSWNNCLGQCSYVGDDFYKKYIENINKGMTPDEAIDAAEASSGQKAPSQWRARGIHIDVKAGTKFGMYIRHETNAPNPDDIGVVVGADGKERFYSNAEHNPDMMYIDGELSKCVHASTYMYTAPSGIEYRVLGFEDWLATASEGNHSNSSDLDLNDMMFFIDSDDPGMIPDVFDEDPGEELKWIVACEDLGNLDDFDFNDVVFQVRHVSGREQAYITPLAAGGTLETYLHYVDANGTDRIFGDAEWHEHFGVYDPSQMINTRGGITHTARERSITVGADFTLLPVFHDGAGNQFGTTEFKQNMGGMYVSVVRADGTRDDIIPPSRSGEAPQMFLIPQARNKHDAAGNAVDDANFNYKWLWPIERHAIELAYPRFTDWIKDSNNNADWHLDPQNEHVVTR